jgi:hypothetical protein
LYYLTKHSQEPTTYVQIYAGGAWTGSILDSEFDSASHDGFGNTKIPFICDNGIYSVSFQNGQTFGTFTIKIIIDGKIVDEGQSSAEYGVVTLSGNC